MDQSDQSPPNRRRFFGLAFRSLGYAAPAVLALAVPALVPEEAEGVEPQKGMMGKRMMKRMMMKMPMPTAMKPRPMM
jgi:hypothetical protein